MGVGGKRQKLGAGVLAHATVRLHHGLCCSALCATSKNKKTK